MGWRLVDWILDFLLCLLPRRHPAHRLSENTARLREASQNLGSAQRRQAKVASVHQAQRNSESFSLALKKSDFSVSQLGWRIRRSHHLRLCRFSAEANRESIFGDGDLGGSANG